MNLNTGTSIPTPLKSEGLRFIKVRTNSKSASEPKWETTNNYRYDDPVIVKYISHGGNYGIMPVGQGICILDADGFKRLDQLKALEVFGDTFTVRSGSLEGDHYHYFFTCPGITFDKKLVFYDLVDNKKHLGEFYVPGCNAYVVGAGSTHPSGNKYVITNDAPLKEISIETLEETFLCKVKSKHIFVNAKLLRKQLQHKMPAAFRRSSNSLVDRLGLRIEDFAYPDGEVEKRGHEIQGSHPLHGSTTGMNFAINTQKNNWFCYRDQVGGGVLEFIAVKAEFIDCSDVGSEKIEGDLFLKVKQYLKENGFQQQIEDLDAGYRRREALPGRVVDREALNAVKCEDSLIFKHELPKNNILAMHLDTSKKCTDAYIEYIFGAGLSILSALVFRNAVCKMAQGDIYPNTWIFILGISTSSRKSTVVNQARGFLEEITPATQLPSSFSPEGFLEELSENPRSWLFKDEVGQLMRSMNKAYMSDMRDTFCDLYECKAYRRKLRKNQRTGLSETIITDPYITMLVATTPSVFNEYATSLDLTSGWLLRYLYFAPRYSKQIMPMKPKTKVVEKEIGEIKKIFSSYYDFFHSEVTMEFCLSEEALDLFQKWQIEKETDLVESGDENALSIFGRIVTYAVKLAILFQIGSIEFRDYVKDNKGKMPTDAVMEVDNEYIQEACRQMDEYFLPMAYSVAKEVDRSETTNTQNKIMGLIRRNGGRIGKRELMQILHIKVKELNESAEALVQSDEIEILDVKDKEGNGQTTRYFSLVEKPEIAI